MELDRFIAEVGKEIKTTVEQDEICKRSKNETEYLRRIKNETVRD
jgi:hypothetical protein